MGNGCFFFDYREKLLSNYPGIFPKRDTIDPNEPEDERKEREAEERKQDKWSWFLFAYHLAKGSILEHEKIFGLNFIYVLNFRSCEIENKKAFEHYDYSRYTIGTGQG